MKYLLDTNVISETIKLKPNDNVINWLKSVDSVDLCISVLTLGEIRKGIEMLPQGRKRNELLKWMEYDLIRWFGADRILSVDFEVAYKWGIVCASLGRDLPAIDGLIASIASVHNLALVTRNVRDFNGILGLEIIDPWQ